MSIPDLDGNEALLHLLGESWDAQQYKSIETSKWTRDYLTRLTSLPLDELLREPAELRVEQEKLRMDAQQLAFNDYPAFIHANTCRHLVDSTLDELQGHLDGFLDSVPVLKSACEAFEKSAAGIVNERNKITRVLEYQNVLVDLLEIPQLMETCVWNGYYAEAMDLASHVRLLCVRYPLDIVQSIQKQVQASADLMLVQLVSHLRRPIKLAAAMNVIGHLRRMDAFTSEVELRMIFLRCRHDHLTQRLDRIKRGEGEAFEYIKRYIDVMREQMFEIATQYMSVFSQQEQQSILILSDYMIRLLRDIQTLLETQLPKVTDTSSLASILTQLQYCGMSLGRVGLDFRYLFVHIFQESVQPLILQWIDKATEDLVQAITSSTSSPSSWMSSSRYSSNNQLEHVRSNQPPMLLVDYPPLAIFTNAILTAFNSLRLLPAVNLLEPISKHLDACYLEIGSALKQYGSRVKEESLPDEEGVVDSFLMAYVLCCVPYLRDCLFNGIYGSIGHGADIYDSDLEELLGVTSHGKAVVDDAPEELAIDKEKTTSLQEVTIETQEGDKVMDAQAAEIPTGEVLSAHEIQEEDPDREKTATPTNPEVSESTHQGNNVDLQKDEEENGSHEEKKAEDKGDVAADPVRKGENAAAESTADDTPGDGEGDLDDPRLEHAQYTNNDDASTKIEAEVEETHAKTKLPGEKKKKRQHGKKKKH